MGRGEKRPSSSSAPAASHRRLGLARSPRCRAQSLKHLTDGSARCARHVATNHRSRSPSRILVMPSSSVIDTQSPRYLTGRGCRSRLDLARSPRRRAQSPRHLTGRGYRSQLDLARSPRRRAQPLPAVATSSSSATAPGLVNGALATSSSSIVALGSVFGVSLLMGEPLVGGARLISVGSV
jgi:hypothetical protein